LTATEAITLSFGVSESEAATLTGHETDSTVIGSGNSFASDETGTLSADEVSSMQNAYSSVEFAALSADEFSQVQFGPYLYLNSTEVSEVSAIENSNVQFNPIPPTSENEGVGRIWFGGVDITQPPYYAHLQDSAKMNWLDGFDSMQFTTSPLSTISTRPYLKDWVISMVIRPKVPDNSRISMNAAAAALAELFDPTKGEQQLILAEWPASFFMAKRQKSNPANENVVPTQLDLDFDLACTGPAYSVLETVYQQTIYSTTNTQITVTSNGDSLVSPMWTFYAGGTLNGGIEIKNTTTGESVSWAGTLHFGDQLEFIMDPIDATSRTVFLNGEQALSSISGPAWPHLAPGENTILLRQTGPTQIRGIFEVVWRDRFLVGAQTVPPAPVVRPAKRPTEVGIGGAYADEGGSYIFSGEVTDIMKERVANVPVTLYASPDNTTWANLGSTITDGNGEYTFPATATYTTLMYFYVGYGGSSAYFPSISGVIVAVPYAARTPTILTLTANATGGGYYTFSGTITESPSGIPLAGMNILLMTNVPGGTNQPAQAPIYFEGQANTQVAISDANGNYNFQYFVGPTWNGITGLWYGNTGSITWDIYFSTYFAGDLHFQPAAGLDNGNAVIISDQTTMWPAVEPGPITYTIALAPQIISNNNGILLNYFAACGFTKIVLIAEEWAYVSYAEDGSIATYNNYNYANELAIIQSFGFEAAIDIEKVAAGVPAAAWSTAYVSAQYEQFGPWFEILQAAGWTVYSTEMSGRGSIEFARQYFTGGYINLTPLEIFSWYGPDGITYWEQAIDINTTQNNIESYYQYDPPFIYAGALQAAEIGIPNGLTAYADVDVGSIMPNSLAGVEPSYLSMIAYSFDNGFPMSEFELWIDPGTWSILDYSQDPVFFINFMQMNGFDTFIIEQLQQTFPAANTENLIPINIVATNIDLVIVESPPGTVTFSGNLYENLTGVMVPDSEITIQQSPTSATPHDWIDIGTTTTDSNGNFSVEASVTPGTWNFRAYFPGDETHIQGYGPLSIWGEVYTVV
jgi:hypothetical protein